MFEPIHGSAFDIVGKGIANPLGAFWTGAMMLEHLGEGPAAARLMAAIEKVTEGGPRTPDLGGQAGSADVTRAVLAALRSEEHTSELQSLMRISYAVFCLKKKTETKTCVKNKQQDDARHKHN